MADIVSLRPAPGSFVSGGALAHGFTEKWGVLSGVRAHFWLRHPHGYERLCDARVVPAFMANGQCPIFEPGNFPRCKKCEKRA